MNCRRCNRRRPYLAVLHGDEFCSRECAEITYGTREKNQASVKDVALLESRALYRGPKTRTTRTATNAKYWAKYKARGRVS